MKFAWELCIVFVTSYESELILKYTLQQNLRGVVILLSSHSSFLGSLHFPLENKSVPTVCRQSWSSNAGDSNFQAKFIHKIHHRWLQQENSSHSQGLGRQPELVSSDPLSRDFSSDQSDAKKEDGWRLFIPKCPNNSCCPGPMACYSMIYVALNQYNPFVFEFTEASKQRTITQ